MPDWKSIDEAYSRLLSVRAVCDKALAVAIEGRNGGALPALELLVDEVEQLTRAVLAAFGHSPAIART